MANQQLVDYIKAQLAAGVARADLQKAIVGSGWSMMDASAAFAAAEGKPIVAAPAPQPIVAPVQMQPQTKPLPVIHMHPQDGLLRSPVLWTGLAVLVIAGLGVAAYFFTPIGPMLMARFAPAPVVQPVATTTPPVTEQLYVNAAYGFSLKYPSTISPVPAGADIVFALPNFNVMATTSARAVASCLPKTATTTINGVEFTVQTATSTASTTMQAYATVHAGACITLDVLNSSADPILRSFQLLAASTTPAASTTVVQ